MSFRCLYRRKKLWGIVFAALLLLGLIGCGQGKPADPPAEKHPLEGAQSLKIFVRDNGLVEVRSDTLDEPKRIVPDRLEEELSPLLGETLPSTVEDIEFHIAAEEDLALLALALVKEIPAGVDIDIWVESVPWPERLTAEKIHFWESDLSKALAETYPRVRELQLSYCRNVTEKTVVGAFPNLRDLRINTGNLLGWDRPMPTVEHAYFANCAGLTFEMLGTYFPALTELGLGLGTFPEDLSKISQTGIKELIFYRYDEEVREEWTALEDRYALNERYDLSAEADREALSVLLPYSAQEIAECCVNHGIQVYLQMMQEHNGIWLPDPLEYSPGT